MLIFSPSVLIHTAYIDCRRYVLPLRAIVYVVCRGSAGFVLVLCWSLSWSLLVSLFCAGFVLVSAGLCRFRCFVLVLCWSLLVSASFAVLCWFCAGLSWSLPVSLFCAGFVLVSAGLCWFRCFVLVLRWSHRKRFNSFQDTLLESQKDIYIYRDAYWAISWMFVHNPSVDELDNQVPPQLSLRMPIQSLSAADVNLQAEGRERFHDVAWFLHTRI